MRILIKGGRVIDPHNNLDDTLDILTDDEKILKVAKNITDSHDKTIYAQGLWIMPGFIDLHVHLREPGLTYKETIKTGTTAAAAGGFTTVCAMANTSPVADSKEVLDLIYEKVKTDALVNVCQIAAITKGMQGITLTDVESLIKANAIGISDDGKSVKNSSLMQKALEQCKIFNVPLFSHAEDDSFKGHINKGATAEKFGLDGIPNEMEDLIVLRDIYLNKNINAKLHICHICTEGTVDIIRFFKSKNIIVTCEVTPHHFTLTDEDIKQNNGNYKMAPPLRSKKDLEAILNALKDDTIDVIATDHAPHSEDEKNVPIDKAFNGIVGLETAFSLCVTHLVNKNILTPIKLVEKLTINPANIININKGTLSVGAIADITIADPNFIYNIDSKKFNSKSKNTPFDNDEVCGKIIYTIVNGIIVYGG